MFLSKKHILGIAVGLGLGVLLLVGHLRPRFRHNAVAQATTSPVLPQLPHPWPDPEAQLTVPSIDVSSDVGPYRIYIDAGHGATKNPGNTSCFCIEEQQFTFQLAHAVADRLEATGTFDVWLSRETDRLIDYKDRVDEAERLGAQAFISLHSDVRGKFDHWAPQEGLNCPVSHSAPGFSVLWSDEAESPLLTQRLQLAQRVAHFMQQAGFLAYNGVEYTGLYQADAVQAGVFVDRHQQGQRIFVLRKPSIPSILIETHHALDPREAKRWEDPQTIDVFAMSLAAALIETIRDEG